MRIQIDNHGLETSQLVRAITY